MPNTTVPLSATILLTVLAPAIALVGVLFTQWRSDVRAAREAEQRSRAERKLWQAQDRRSAYVKFMVATSVMSEATQRWDSGKPETWETYDRARHNIWEAFSTVVMVGPLEVEVAATEYRDALAADANNKISGNECMSWATRQKLRVAFQDAAKETLHDVDPFRP
jgi:hypothetical protein